MAKSRTLVLNTKVDVTGTDKVKSLGQTLQGALNPSNILKGLAGGFLASEAFQLIESATNAAAEFQDTVSATGVIIGEELQEPMEQWAETASSAFGASKQDALAAANQMAVFGKAAGLSGQELVDFSQDLTQLGGDLASFFGGTTEDAITAVGSALRGEFEPIRRYGVLLDDATLRQKAFELGLISTTKNALTPQQKTLAAQAAIFEQTADAQGDFERTSDGMANTQRQLAAELENVNIELGEKLLPVMVEFARFVRDDGIPILQGLVESLDEVGFVAQGVLNVFDATPGFIGGFADDMGSVQKALEGAGLAAGEAKPLFDAFGGDLSKVRDELDRWAAEGVDVRTGIRNIGRDFSGLPTAVATALRTGKEVVSGAAEEVAGTIPAAMEGAQFEAAGIAADTPGELARSLLDGLEAWRESWETMEEAATAEQEKGQRIRQNLRRLASVELINALRSDNVILRTAAQQTRADLIQALTIDGHMLGENLMISFANGIAVGKAYALTHARLAADAIRGIFPSSEPKDPHSPLRGWTHLGGDMIRILADDMMRTLEVGRRAGAALSATLTPSLGTPSLATVPVGAAPGVSPAAGGVHFHFHVEGPLTPERERGIEGVVRQSLSVVGMLERSVG